MASELLSANAEFHGDLIRNIPGIRRSQSLFDDLTADPADWAIAVAFEESDRIPTTTAIATRPFDYGSVISYSFDAAHWQNTRFSDGTRYGVWYGALEVETTVYETAHHWRRFLLDSYADLDRVIVTDRRVCDVRCDALLIDLRNKHTEYPDLVRRDSYTFTHQVGRVLHQQDLSGLLVSSARCKGINAAIFRAERLSNVRDKLFVTYRVNVVRDTFVAERTRNRAWLSFAPSSLE
ncbi:MAG: RES family NAD+ phosphorylase [Burkholderiaceae bacterium]